MSFDTFEASHQFNRSIHTGVLCLDARCRHDDFDAEKLKACADAINRAKAATNAYLIAVIGTAESAQVSS